MKIFKTYLLPIFILTISALAMQSCKDKESSEENASGSMGGSPEQFASNVNKQLAAVGNDDADMYMTAGLARLLDQADFSLKGGNIELPQDLKTILSNVGDNPKEITQALNSIKGVDYSSVLLAADTKKQQFILVASVNYDQFLQSLRKAPNNKGVKSGQFNGYQTIENGNYTIVSKDGLLFAPFSEDILNNGATPQVIVGAVEEWKNNATKSPIAQWKKDFLTQNNVLNILCDPKSMSDLADLTPLPHKQQRLLDKFREFIPGDYTEMSINLEGPSLVMNSAAVDKNGTPVNLNIAGNFDTKLLEYASPNDVMAMSLSINSKTAKNIADNITDIAEIIDPDKFTASDKAKVKSIISLVAASWPTRGIFFTVGVDKDVTVATAMSRPTEELFNVVIAAEFDNDMVASGIYGLLQQKFAEEGKDVIIKQDGNIIAISNKPIKKYTSNPYDASMFKGSAFALQYIVNQNNLPQAYDVFKQMNITEGIDFKGSVRNTGGNATLTLTGTNKKLIPAIYNILLKAGM